MGLDEKNFIMNSPFLKVVFFPESNKEGKKENNKDILMKNLKKIKYR